MRALLAFLVALALPAGAEPLRIGTEPDYAPYILRDPATGELTGFDKQMGDEICRRGGFDCEWVPMLFSDLVPSVAAGEIDIAIAGMADTPARRQIVAFTRTYRDILPSAGAYAALRPGLSSEGLVAGVQQGTVHADFLAAAGRPHVTFPDTASMIAALRTGEVGVVFGGWGNLEAVIATTDPDLRIVEVVDVPSYPTAIAVGRDRASLRMRIDAIIAGMEKDGTLDRLERRWFPEGMAL